MATKSQPDKKQSVLQPEVAAQFEVPEGALQIFVSASFGRVDLSEIDLQLAAQLADKGYLIRI